jgi:hypothetical protein
MKTPRTLMVVLFAISALPVQPALAQGGMRWRGGAGQGPGSASARMYDPKTVETIAGQVVSVETATPSRGTGNGVHLLLNAGDGPIAVHLGPAWYLQNQALKLGPGDYLQVRGSRITYDGKPAVIAAEVKKGDEVLKLRDDAGFPLWSGWRRL